MSVEYLFGIQPVLAALRSQTRSRIHQLLLYDNNSNVLHNKEIKGIVELAKQTNIKIQYTTKTILDQYSLLRPHQNVALQVTPLQISKKVEYDWRHGLLLVDVSDPQNVGAIIRTAAFFACDRLFLGGNCAPLSPLVSKASAGALEYYHPQIRQVPKVGAFLDILKPEGYKIVATGTSSEKETVNLSSDKTIVLLGNEGDGLRQSILDRCSRTVCIPGSPSAASLGLDSLNVSVTAALILATMKGITI